MPDGTTLEETESIDIIDPQELDNFLENNSSDLENGVESSNSQDSEQENFIDLQIKEVNKNVGIRAGSSQTWNIAKRLVSKNKKRYVQGGYDLDLSYISEQIIAMGYPSESIEGWYRNSIRDVQRFFAQKHPKHYKIYNLCSERKYSWDGFEKGSINEDFGFDDHNPPPFEMILKFCSSCFEFLSKDKKNVVAIHCKAGKGRTGVMICCYLVFEGHQRMQDPNYDHTKKIIENSKDALVYYGKIRTSDAKGVTIPSQIRYVYYFDHFLKLLTYTHSKKA